MMSSMSRLRLLEKEDFSLLFYTNLVSVFFTDICPLGYICTEKKNRERKANNRG